MRNKRQLLSPSVFRPGCACNSFQTILRFTTLMHKSKRMQACAQKGLFVCLFCLLVDRYRGGGGRDSRHRWLALVGARADGACGCEVGSASTCTKKPLVSQLFLCLSRACLGKMIGSSINGSDKAFFAPSSLSSGRQIAGWGDGACDAFCCDLLRAAAAAPTVSDSSKQPSKH